jgi:hypothetical protein
MTAPASRPPKPAGSPASPGSSPWCWEGSRWSSTPVRNAATPASTNASSWASATRAAPPRTGRPSEHVPRPPQRPLQQGRIDQRRGDAAPLRAPPPPHPRPQVPARHAPRRESQVPPQKVRRDATNQAVGLDADRADFAQYHRNLDTPARARHRVPGPRLGHPVPALRGLAPAARVQHGAGRSGPGASLAGRPALLRGRVRAAGARPRRPLRARLRRGESKRLTLGAGLPIRDLGRHGDIRSARSPMVATLRSKRSSSSALVPGRRTSAVR